MKKLITVLLCISLAITTFIVVFADAPEITCSLSNKEVKIGETFTVTVSINNYEPIRSGAISLKFDQSVLEYVDGEWLIDAGVKSFDTEKLNGVFMFFPVEPHDINGDIFRFTLKVLAEAPSAGDFEIIATPQLINADGDYATSGESATSSVEVSCAEHKYGVLNPEVPAKCGAEGKKAYYECSVCHKLFNEEQNEI